MLCTWPLVRLVSRAARLRSERSGQSLSCLRRILSAVSQRVADALLHHVLLILNFGEHRTLLSVVLKGLSGSALFEP